jgi:hypothetical protein
LPEAAVRIVGGFGSPYKTVEISGLDSHSLSEKLK